MEIPDVKEILEALLFVSEKPLTLKELKDIIKPDFPDTSDLGNILNELKDEYDNLNKPYEIKFIAEGWTFATKPQYHPWIKKLLKEKSVLKLSASALETLAVVAYKQPVTRAEIDDIRGVESSGVIDTLLERKLIKITGKKESLGKPLLYSTTQEFLKHFGLARLSELPLIENVSETIQQKNSICDTDKMTKAANVPAADESE
ncbi:MAG: SMC-Scp complex subunit ScpB [Endomicrobium sp.]|jgi:segregation and condensation protein B|nr:SMC-Scp complex subunit ScpB [Endomicrobium sp.]